MQDKAKTQAAVDADGHAGGVADVAWQRIEPAGQQLEGVLVRLHALGAVHAGRKTRVRWR